LRTVRIASRVWSTLPLDLPPSEERLSGLTLSKPMKVLVEMCGDAHLQQIRVLGDAHLRLTGPAVQIELGSDR
jgi:hypothetical protein